MIIAVAIAAGVAHSLSLCVCAQQQDFFEGRLRACVFSRGCWPTDMTLYAQRAERY
jgi:hypothetical protein